MTWCVYMHDMDGFRREVASKGPSITTRKLTLSSFYRYKNEGHDDVVAHIHPGRCSLETDTFPLLKVSGEILLSKCRFDR